MFGKHITVKDVAAVFSLYQKVMSPPGQYDPAQVEPIAYGLGMVAKAAKDAAEADKLFNEVDMGYL